MNLLLLASAVINLSSFSPVGDGVTDDTKAFVECFRAASKSGARRVVIEPGTYLLSGRQAVPLSSGMTVVAEGAEFRFPESLGDMHHRIMFHGRDVQNVRWRGGFFRGYVFDPDREKNTWEPHANTRAILFSTSKHGATRNISVSDVEASDLSGAAVTVMGHIEKGIAKRAENIDIRNCSLYRTGIFMWDYGYLWERKTFPERFGARDAEYVKKYAIHGPDTLKTFWHWWPKGAGPGKGGIDVQAGKNVIVSGCRMHACGDAMHISWSRDVVFNGNQITGARMGAFFIAHFCRDVSITGNTVDGTGGSRVVSVETDTENVTIVGNIFRNGGRGSWINQPHNIIIANNIFENNTIKCTPELGKGRLTYHKPGTFERYPEIYFTTSRPGAEYGPVIMRDNIFTLSEHASLAVAFRNGGRGIIFEDNVFQGAKKNVYVGKHCDMPRMEGNVGLGDVVREIGDAQSGGGLAEESWLKK